MTEKKRETCVFEGLGFPIVLINAPWKKVLGEWALDINFKKLQHAVLRAIIHKPSSLTGEEVRFIRKFLEMSTAIFGELFGVSHVAVLKWENGNSKMNPSSEIYLRLFVLNYLKATDKEFRNLYSEINLKNLAHSERKNTSLEIQMDKMAY